jgi:hypothetical protein
VQKSLPAEILAKMRHPYIGGLSGVFIKIKIVKPPVMGQIGSHQNNIPGLEPLDIVAHELGALPFFKMY